ncbi:MAG: hypothetical protein IJY62_02630 [Clostridia bacterium]|nr:hypothetical protein [Clostridia bacterium]
MKVLNKKRIALFLLSALLFVASFFGALALNHKMTAKAETKLEGLHITGMTSTNQQQNASIVVNLPSPSTSVGGADELIFDVDVAEPTGVTNYIVFGVVDEGGNWYEYMGKGDLSTSTYRVADDLESLFTADATNSGSWISTHYMKKGRYYALKVSDFYSRAVFNNYGGYTSIGEGVPLSNSAKLKGVILRMGGEASNSATADFSFHNLYLGYKEAGYYSKILDMSTVLPSTSASSENPNGWSTTNGYFFQGIPTGSTAGRDYGWLSPLSTQHYAYEIVKETPSVINDGITVKTNGVTETVTSHASIYVNLPELLSLADVDELIFDLTFDETFSWVADSTTKYGYIVPCAIDSIGNYYEWQGAGSAASTTLKFGKTMENVLSTYNCGTWSNFQPTVRGAFGRGYYTVKASAFYARVGFNNYGGLKLENAVAKGSVFTAEQSIRTIGFRIPEKLYSYVNFTMGDVYAKKTDGSVVRILDASTVSYLENYVYTFEENTAWFGYIGNYGSYDGTTNAATAMGWASVCYAAGSRALGMTMTTASVDNQMTAAFDGMNITLNIDEGEGSFTTGNVYQRIDLPKYTGDMTNKVLVLRYFDRSGMGYQFEPKFRSAVTGSNADYALGGAKVHYFDVNYNFIKSVTHSWSIVPPAGFNGYIVIDTSTITNTSYTGLANRNNVNLMLGFHGNWNTGYYNADFGKITLHTAAVSSSTDLEEYLKTGETYFDFASEAAADGLNGSFTMGYWGNYQNVYTRVYGYKGVEEQIAEMTYAELDEVNESYNKLSAEAKLSVENRATLFGYETIAAFDESFEMTQAAALRLDEPAGLKFAATVDKAAYEALVAMLTEEGISFKMGTLITRSDLLGSEALTVGETAYRKLDIERTVWAKDEDGTYTMYAAIVNILEQNYAQDFTAIAYITFEYNGETIVIYANGGAYSENVRSLATTILETDAASYTSYLDILNKYAGNTNS